VGRQAGDELAGVARQLFTLGVDPDQIGQAQVQADPQRLQVTAAALALPARGDHRVPVQRRPRCRQQRLEALQHGVGALQKTVQKRIHDSLLISATADQPALWAMLGQAPNQGLIAPPMEISPTHRLSFKQARLTVLVAFILGTLMSLIQVGLDYASEDASIDQEIHSLLEISHNPAARISYNIDAELAQELVLGLLRSPAVMRAEIIDNSGLVLASVDKPPAQSRYRVFSDFLFGKQRQFENPLFVSHAPEESLGML